jgi:hypothetical protein
MSTLLRCQWLRRLFPFFLLLLSSVSLQALAQVEDKKDFSATYDPNPTSTTTVFVEPTGSQPVVAPPGAGQPCEKIRQAIRDWNGPDKDVVIVTAEVIDYVSFLVLDSLIRTGLQ